MLGDVGRPSIATVSSGSTVATTDSQSVQILHCKFCRAHSTNRPRKFEIFKEARHHRQVWSGRWMGWGQTRGILFYPNFIQMKCSMQSSLQWLIRDIDSETSLTLILRTAFICILVDVTNIHGRDSQINS